MIEAFYTRWVKRTKKYDALPVASEKKKENSVSIREMRIKLGRRSEKRIINYFI